MSYTEEKNNQDSSNKPATATTYKLTVFNSSVTGI